MTTYGYVRVSTKEQNEDRQLIALAEFDIPAENLFMDKLSGKDFERPAYKNLLCCLEPDDLVIVKSIDRLGRNYAEIQEQWRIITKEKCADIKVLDTPLLDTTYHKDLLGTFIADLVLTVMSYTAQMERENIRQRQEEGILAARERGVHFGRLETSIPDDFDLWYTLWQEKEITAIEFSKRCGVSRSTLYKKIKSYEKYYENDLYYLESFPE
ncbi:MAG: recombinase family protein [Peptococcaceae bacterium]|nr:recombinase family protein [Peptococcaceae bacterium]